MITKNGYQVVAHAINLTSIFDDNGIQLQPQLTFHNKAVAPNLGAVTLPATSINASEVPNFTEPHPQFENPAQMLNYVLDYLYEGDTHKGLIGAD